LDDSHEVIDRERERERERDWFIGIFMKQQQLFL